MKQVINYSEFAALTTCERKHHYAYVEKAEEQGNRRGLNLGTLCHVWHGNWLLHGTPYIPDSWTDDIEPGGKPGEAHTVYAKDFEPELLARALWLRDRFVEHYGSQPPKHWRVLSAEEWLSRDMGKYILVGRSDGVVEIEEELYLLELKTYASKPGPLAYAQVSPQLGCYCLLAEAAYGERPFGVIYQGIYTHRYSPVKPTQKSKIEAWQAAGATESLKDLRSAAKAYCDNPHNWVERDPADSFDRIEVELSDEHLAAADEYLHSAVLRRNQLRRSHVALPNVGQHCSWCSFKDQCWADLSGVEPFEIEVEDDDALPV